MGGDIFVESTQDVGTMVAVHLDFDIFEGDPSLLKKKEVDVSKVDLKGIRVLLVDDNELNLIVNHKANNTHSEVFNHGVNVNTNKLKFNITGSVNKKYSKLLLTKHG